MYTYKYIYSFSYNDSEIELCKLESRYIFNIEENKRLIFSNAKIEPSSSAFIKNRLDIISFSDDYQSLINNIQKEQLSVEGFKVEYMIFDGDSTQYSERLKKLRDIGYSIEGTPDYYNPTKIYAVCLYEGIWYFGDLIKNCFDWQKHNHKPHSYSNSISVNIAKALVNIAANANKEKKLLDACCGVGTIMLEACFAEYNIEGCDINWKIVRNARKNISHFNYIAKIYRSDIKDINQKYDAAIIDLPYNLVSFATEDDVLHIITAAAKITNRLVIVSTSDIANIIIGIGYTVSDHCSIGKPGKRKFERRIWVCDKNE